MQTVEYVTTQKLEEKVEKLRESRGNIDAYRSTFIYSCFSDRNFGVAGRRVWQTPAVRTV